MSIQTFEMDRQTNKNIISPTERMGVGFLFNSGISESMIYSPTLRPPLDINTRYNSIDEVDIITNIKHNAQML